MEKLGRRNVPPVTILLSDGYCTDSAKRYNQAIATLDKLPWGVKSVRVAIGIGQNGDYNKEQLDQFISPYLRQENHLETLPADNTRRLMDFIKVVSTQAVSAAASSKSDLQNQNQVPVQLDFSTLKHDDGPGVKPNFDDLDWNATF